MPEKPIASAASCCPGGRFAMPERRISPITTML